ncbi:putative leucine-rich repeat-containing protein DDB_G0290503 [Battus philenor]|uniref:putative leucine-rich repeat-containing protein DDB_G0290503 n=1 Tax=Battus philenor TaxID=42288 RepID=UPI0035D11043
MSQEIPDEPKIQDIIDAVRMPIKCRIPRSLHAERRGLANKSKTVNNDARPRSTSRGRTDKLQINDTTRSVRSDRDRAPFGLKVRQPTSKRISNENQKSKLGAPVITVPVQQETINQYEELEVQQSDQSYEVLGYTDLSDNDPDKKPKEDILYEWKKKSNEFQRMKNELNNRQRSIMDFYASLNVIHQKMVAAGHKADLPSTEDLHIMNVAKMTPDQLLKLCAETSKRKQKENDKLPSNNGIINKVTKLYNIPCKLVTTCEQALSKRKEIIDWLDSLRSQVSVQLLTKKIKQFNSENEMFAIALNDMKNECMKELQEVEQYMRQSVNDTNEKMAMHLQTETLMYKLSELNSQNADLRKQVNNAENFKTSSARNKITELEKELKEKQKYFKERLSKTECQVRMSKERATQLEAVLDKVKSQLESKEATIKELQEQNEKLQRNNDEELKRLNDCVTANTDNLEQIVWDREKLQNEKDELEKKLVELSSYYNESLNNNKKELIANITKLAETEKMYNTELEAKIRLQSDFSEQLLEAELRTREVLQKLDEAESQLAIAKDLENEYEDTKNELRKANLEIDNYKNESLKQTEAINQMEIILKTTQEENKTIKEKLLEYQQHIEELKKEEESLKTQLQDSEAKMEYYANELKLLKDRIAQLQEQFVGFDDINVLHETIDKQKAEICQASEHNNELNDIIRNNELKLMEISETNRIQNEHLQEKEDLIKTLIKSSEEQCLIIKQLRNNLEVRSNADTDIKQQLEKNNIEINSLVKNLETRKHQILELEKIILTLEDKLQKANLIRKKYEEKLHLLETKNEIYESLHYKPVQTSSNNINQFLKLLEQEIENPIESQDKKDESDTNKNDMSPTKDKTDENQFHGFECHDRRPSNVIDQRTMLKKPVVTESSHKKKILTNDLYKGDNVDRKQANTNVQTVNYPTRDMSNSKLHSFHDDKCKANAESSHEKILMKNLQVLIRNKYQNEKKAKMFALAGHRL